MFPRPPATISLEAWVLPTSVAAVHQTILARGSASNDDNPWWMGVFGGKPRFWTKNVGFGQLLLEGPSALPLGQWSHLVMSFDGSTKRLYVNGVQVASTAGLGALVYDPAAVPVTLGSDWVSGARSQHFPGRVDEASIYGRALTGAEVAALYAEGSRGKDATGPYFNALALSAEILANQPYAYTFAIIRGTAPIECTVSSGALPPGIGLSAMGTANKITGYDAQPFLMGRDTETGIEFYYLRGRLDEVSLYNRALAEGEVFALFDAGFAGKTAVGPYFDQPGSLPGVSSAGPIPTISPPFAEPPR